MKLRFPLVAAGAVFAVHLFGNAHYGFFRDELYFIICGMHPQWGYVDQPPVVPLLAAGTQIFGHSLLLLRIVPALFAAAGMYVTCLLVTEFGGGIAAQVVAFLSYLFAGVLLSFGMKVSPDEVGLLTWPLLALVVVRIVKGADSRLWMIAGAIAGLSIESKYSVLFFLVALAVGLALTAQRRILFNPWFVAGCGIAAAVALPNVIWQASNGFPIWELLRAGQNGKNIVAGPVLFLVQQILITHLFLFPIWLCGLVWLLRTAPYRFLGYTYVVLIAEMIVLHGKHYYPADVYPILMAAGGVQIETWTARHPALRGAAIAYALILGPVFLPFSLPILSEPAFLAYQQHAFDILHIPRSALDTEHGRDVTPLPADWADMHGWPELAATIDHVYISLQPAERAQAVVVTSNYGEASAVAFFTPNVPVISYHNQFWLWGTHGYTGKVVIDVNGDCGQSMHLFRHARLVTHFNAPYTIGWETDVPIMLCEGIQMPIADVWPKIKKYL
jgi:hypothetical protein